MSSIVPIGSLAIADVPAAATPSVSAEDVLNDETPGVEFVYVVEIYPYNLGSAGVEVIAGAPIGSLPLSDVLPYNYGALGVEGLFFATREWATAPGDVPPSQPFDGRLRNPLRLTRSLLGGERFASLASGGGNLSIDNADGAYDSFITGYGIDGRRVVVKVGRTTDAYTDFVSLFDGTARDWRGTVDTIEVILRDHSFKLDVPAQPNTFAGTGSDEGGTDLVGKRRPLMLGYVEHGAPALVDPALLIYQANDGTIVNTMSVTDTGVALTPGGADQASYAALAAFGVAAGEYEFYLAGGYIKLGSLPDGRVTYRNAQGAALSLTGAIVQQLLGATTVVVPQEIDSLTFDELDALQTASIGILIGADEAISAADAIADLLEGIGGFAAFDQLGRLYVKRIDAPSGDPLDSFGETDIVSLEREPLPAGLSPPPWRSRLAYERNYAVLTGELAGSVSAADRAYLSEAYLLAQASDPTISTVHPLSSDPSPVESYFAASSGGAQDEAERLLFLYGTERSLGACSCRGGRCCESSAMSSK